MRFTAVCTVKSQQTSSQSIHQVQTVLSKSKLELKAIINKPNKCCIPWCWWDVDADVDQTSTEQTVYRFRQNHFVTTPSHPIPHHHPVFLLSDRTPTIRGSVQPIQRKLQLLPSLSRFPRCLANKGRQGTWASLKLSVKKLENTTAGNKATERSFAVFHCPRGTTLKKKKKKKSTC